jgi:hypothetical protein
LLSLGMKTDRILRIQIQIVFLSRTILGSNTDTDSIFFME